MNFGCILGHDYERLTTPKPVKYGGEFDSNFFDGHYALGRCRNCGKYSMRQRYGNFSYYPSDMKTKEEWLGILVAESTQQGGENNDKT